MSESDYISDEDLKKDFPLLFGQSREENFEIPKGYFDSLPSKVIDRIKTEGDLKVITLKSKKIKWMYKAAAIAAMLVIGVFILNLWNQENTSDEFLLSFENIEISEDYLLDFDEDLMIEVLLSYQTEFEENYEDPYMDFLEEEFETEELIFEL